MSRSNPSSDIIHPCQWWFEWNGEKGYVGYYDKKLKEKKNMGNRFPFILLDQLSVIKGWHERSKSGITSNEIRDSRIDPMSVRSFKGGPIANGLYSAIKDRVGNSGGYFCSSLYLAFKGPDKKLTIGNLKLAGAALNIWVEFSRENREQLNTHAVLINGGTAGKKGSVNFVTPKFFIQETAKETNDEAILLDKKLQEYLKAYFARKVGPVAAESTAEAVQEDAPSEFDQGEAPLEEPPETAEDDSDSVPF